LCKNLSPPKRERGMPGARCTRSRAWCVESTRVSHHERTGITRHSRTRMVLTVSFVLSPVIGLSCHRRQRNGFHRLDASVEASGPYDFAVHVSAVRQRRHPRPPHPCPTFVTIAKRPFVWAGMAEHMQVIWVKGESKYFCRAGWTEGQISGASRFLISHGSLADWRSNSCLSRAKVSCSCQVNFLLSLDYVSRRIHQKMET
jgi:hypothetical protein